MAQQCVLLVEDNKDNFELVRFLLEKNGYRVFEAHTGQQALDIARQELPDLILMDLSLPQMDGWTAARELKADLDTAIIPLVALTAHTLPGDRKRALESGFNGFISKPIDVQAFPGKIAQALETGKFDHSG
jgi:two-component system cell cycle response regulator DivK